ncbi:MAG TPA: DUF1611 domain-containing protein [Phycisphaerae bacterium]|nr:DUF1611 domain-containing protein [Phycisphaerae bacterium]HRY68673.1 DUF1611 domain-containing protein [Phycisphaerae bacterium]HSA25499.1 DUF1611 domain-containing protein [Phycisphaerae bacterium]
MLFEMLYRRLLILTEGSLGIFESKTGSSVMRYRPQDCVAVLDSVNAGKPLGDFIPGLPDLPIVASVADTLPLQPDALLIGIAPTGGGLPDRMRRHLLDALKAGLSIISGLHVMLRDDPELAELAEANNAKLHDVRDAGQIRHIARGRARYTRAKRVLTIGIDCDVGKMVTALELRKEAVRQGLNAAFVATGQTGIMIEGWGIAIDHVISDFTAGATELLVEHVADKDMCFVEGQGSIEHPGYSAVTLGLLHGSCPDAMVIVCRPDRLLHNDWPDCPVAPIRQQIAINEALLAPLHPGKVVAVAVNTARMTAEDAEAAVRKIAGDAGLPAADPVRHGCKDLIAAIRRQVGI